MFEARKVKRKALVVMTGDKGLCGAYNANLMRVARKWIAENMAFDPHIIPVGKVGFEFFRKKNMATAGGWAEKAVADLELAKTITAELKQLFLEKRFDSIEMLYTTFRVGGTGQNKLDPFLGLSYLAQSRKKASDVDYIYEPDLRSVFAPLLTRYLEGKMYATLLESLTSEYGARMVAMKQASENGEEVLDELKLLRNKTRQATITRELSEIVSGASILV